MNFRILLYFFCICAGLTQVRQGYAQVQNADSITRMREAQKRAADSMREARIAFADSLRAVREKRADSLRTIREYRASKHYKDSVAEARQYRLDSIKAVRTAYFDSIRTERKRITDSIVAVRKARTDSIRAVQKHRADSIAVVRKYRECKRYKDSVAVVRKMKLDALKAERKAYNDSVADARRAVIDSMMAARKEVTDSMMAARKQKTDSIAAVRKIRTDSLAKVAEAKKQQRKAEQKRKEEKKQMAFELKLKKKRAAWSNEKMLKKKWSAPRQVIQNTFTRYNYYFNADRKMDEAIANMLRNKKENYDSLLALFPYDPDRDSSLLAADMDSIVQKASLGIQIHDPRTKWGDDLYLLMGQAYYYKGSYENAATTFKYIVSLRDKTKKKGNSGTRVVSRRGEAPSVAQAEDKGAFDFLKHRSVHNESILWLARTYTQSEQVGNAESVLDMLETDPNFPESMNGRMALERAYAYLSTGDFTGAVKHLDVVAADNNLPDWLRMRASFLAGQLYQEQQNYTASIASFKTTLSLHPQIEMDFYALKNLAYSSMYAGSSQEEAIASLKKVLKDAKYTPYYEQVYYVMGRLAASNGNREDAIAYMKKSIESPKSTKKQKALSYATLGDVYYKSGSYIEAKSAYDSVAALIAAAPDDPIIEIAMKRAMALGSVTKPYITIYEQDSLLTLAAMSEKDQRQVVRKYIRMLEDRKADSAFLAENAGVNAAMQNADNNAPGNNNNTAPKFYFTNPVLMQQGFNEFRREWGNRPLVDNWRRIAAVNSRGGSNPISNNDIAGNNDTVMVNGKVIEYDAQGLPTEESLFLFIPRDAEEKDAAMRLLMRAHIELANAYVKDLEDYPPAIKTLDTLDKRFPDHPHKAESVYIRYIIALRQGKLQEAQQYSELLTSKYSDSKYADMVRPSESGAGLTDMTQPVQEYYDETYRQLLDRQYSAVLVRVRDAQRRYSNIAYNKRFTIIEGIASVGVEDYDKADSLLSTFVRMYPTDSLRPWADAVLNYVRTNRPPPPPKDTTAVQILDSNAIKAGSVQEPAAGSVITPNQDVQDFMPVEPINPAPAPPPIPKEYAYDPKADHYAAIFIPAMEQRAMGMKAAVSDFNTFKFGSLGLQTDIKMLQTDQGIIYTQKFKSAGQAKIYINSLASTTQIFREYKPNEYELFVISEPNYRKMEADKNVREYLLFYKQKYK